MFRLIYVSINTLHVYGKLYSQHNSNYILYRFRLCIIEESFHRQLETIHLSLLIVFCLKHKKRLARKSNKDLVLQLALNKEGTGNYNYEEKVVKVIARTDLLD